MESEPSPADDLPTPEIEKEAWNYRAFVEAYNAQGGLPFVEGEFANSDTLHREYLESAFKTVAEFAVSFHDGEQGESADTLPVRYRNGTPPLTFENGN